MGIIDRLSSEWAYLTGSLRTLKRSGAVLKSPGRTARELIEEGAAKYGDSPALISAKESYSYARLDARTSQYARWAQARGLAKGDTVAMFMPNRAEFLAIWLGLVKTGCIAAWVNTGLAGHSLAHCIEISGAKVVFVDRALMPAFETARALLPQGVGILVYGEGAGTLDARLDLAVAGFGGEPLAGAERVPLTIGDRAVYVFTSGTTGLPKAANVNHSRLMRIMEGFSGAIDANASDRMYISLPLYHTTGGICATGAVLTVGGCAVIAEKFSAGRFMTDIAAQNCTMFVYVGELCRYLLATPPGPADRAHKLRKCFGNGLRKDAFEGIRQRFGLTHILEFYGATEGNISLFNFDSTAGAVGRIPKWAEKRYNVKIVKFDFDSEQPLRGADGFCVECPHGETGEVIAQIVDDPLRPSNKFDGYADKAATEKKILRNAFSSGDAWFRSGDLMKRDALGYFYFQDRMGDTYRWKGENVSTGEVTAAITSYPGIEDANIYGVTLEGREGRAGMAAIALTDAAHFDLPGLRAHLAARLPDYARPLFIRIQHHIDLTGTFKQRKVEMVAQGFDPGQTGDPLYFNDARAGAFVPLDAAVFADVQSGRVRV